MSELNNLLIFAVFLISGIFAGMFLNGFWKRFQRSKYLRAAIYLAFGVLFSVSTMKAAHRIYLYANSFDHDVLVANSLCESNAAGEIVLSGRCLLRQVNTPPDAFDEDFIIIQTDDRKIFIRSQAVEFIR